MAIGLESVKIKLQLHLGCKFPPENVICILACNSFGDANIHLLETIIHERP